MRFPQIPSIEEAWCNVFIESLSPSNFAWVNYGCGYQVLLQKALHTFRNDSISLPRGRNAILGTIIHKMYELTIRGEMQSIQDLKNKWEELLFIEKGKLAACYPTLRNADLNDYDKRNCAIRYAIGMMRKPHFVPTNDVEIRRKVFSEKKLECPEIGLRGVADKLVLENGFVDIIDFKSGHVFDENGSIKADYRVQMHLYAAMCQCLSLGTPRFLSLVDIEGKNYDIPFSQDYCARLLIEVKDTLRRLNDAVASTSFHPLAKPDSSICPNCSCRHICQYRNVSLDFAYQTLSGIVVSIPSTNMYVLNCGTDTYYVSGLDAYEIDSPKEYLGKQLVFVNIVRASQNADNHTYKIIDNTLVYEQL